MSERFSDAAAIQGNPILADPESRVLQLGPRLADEAVLIGSGAVRATLGEVARVPNDTDVAVPVDALDHLRRHHPNWEETRLPDGTLRLMGDGYDVSTGWGKGLSTE